VDVYEAAQFDGSGEERPYVLPKAVAELLSVVLPNEIFGVAGEPWIEHLHPAKTAVRALDEPHQPLHFNPDVPAVELSPGWGF